MKKLATIAAVAVALSLAAPAFAQTAEEHAARATRFYNLQDWPNALREYKESYSIDPKPEVLWSIAQVERLSGDCRSALFTYKAYARGASAAGANAAQDLIAKCEATLAAQEQAVDAAAPARAPAPPPVVVRAPAPAPVVREKPKSNTPWILDPLGDVLAIVALGGLATGATFLTLGNVGMGDAGKATPYQAYDHDVDVARTQQQIGVGVAIGGAVFAGLAIWRWAVVAGRKPSRESSHAPAPTLAVVPIAGGAFTTYAMRF